MTRDVENRWYITPPIVYGKRYYYITTILLPATTEKFGSNRHRSLWGTYRAEPARLCRKREMRTDEHIYTCNSSNKNFLFFKLLCTRKSNKNKYIYICACILIPLNYWLVANRRQLWCILHIRHTHIYIYIRFKGIRIKLVNIYDVDKLFCTAI